MSAVTISEAPRTGYDYDVVDSKTGESVMLVRHLWPQEPVDCCICEKPTYSSFCVPYYCGPVQSGKSQGGYKTACERCYARWEKWDDGLTEYDSWSVAATASQTDSKA
jgi:hypothetical protein